MITGVAGVNFAGPIRPALQTWIGFAAGVASDAREPEAARALVQYPAAPANLPVLGAFGIEP